MEEETKERNLNNPDESDGKDYVKEMDIDMNTGSKVDEGGEDQKEGSLSNGVEQADEEKTDKPLSKESAAYLENDPEQINDIAESGDCEELADLKSDVELNSCRTFQDSEDELETNSISNIVEPKQKILWAAEKNEVDVVRHLLEEEASLVNARDEDLYTPLHRACSNNHTEIIKLLLSCGADLAAQTEDGWCPLHCACRWDSVEAASLLLQNGANINATSKGGLSPLHLAAANSSGRRTLELLIWHPHIDGTLKAENGDTAYDVACRTSNTLLRLFELLDESSNRF